MGVGGGGETGVMYLIVFNQMSVYSEDDEYFCKQFCTNCVNNIKKIKI